MLKVFGDESADATKQRVFAIAGVVGREEEWNWLEERWNICNDGIPFHAADCESDTGDYTGRDHALNQNLYRGLTNLLAASGLGGWGFAIDLAAQRRIFPDAPDIAYFKCFLEVAEAMKNCALNNRETIEFTFDSRRESDFNTRLLYETLTSDPDWKPYVSSAVSFKSSRDEPRVQIADLFARETMKALDNIIGPTKRPPRKSWLALRRTGHFHITAISNEWFEDLKRQLPLLEEKTGMSRGGYLGWLRGVNGQHNTTNLIRYIEWNAKRDANKAAKS